MGMECFEDSWKIRNYAEIMRGGGVNEFLNTKIGKGIDLLEN